jgi:cytosine/adenosine deaminase-related metal-dependent hydrolase
MSTTLVLTGCDALTAPGAGICENVDVVVRGGRIATVESAGSRPPESGAEVVDARGLLAIPGLVNAHTHSPENPMRGLGERLAMEPWLCLMLATAGRYTSEDHYICALAGAVEMLHHGTSAVLDHMWGTPPTIDSIDAALRAYRDIGIRATLAPLVDDTDFTDAFADQVGFRRRGTIMPQRHRGKAAELAALLDETMTRWHGAEDGRLCVQAGPTGVHWCTDELLLALAEVADRHGSAIHVHLLETRLENLTHRQVFGRSGTQRLADLGILGRCSLAHSVWLDEFDVGLVAEHGAKIVHNPAANLRLASGLAPIRAYLDAGVTVGLGTDGAAASDNQVLWNALKLVALIHNVLAPSGDRWISAREALTMATAGGAAVLDRQGELGTLEPGMIADIMLLDRRGDGLAGAHEFEAALVFSETGRGVRHVIVAGEVVLRDGRCTRIDEDASRTALAELARSRAAEQPSAETLASVRQLQELRRAVGADTAA